MEEIFKRAHLQNICDYLICGTAGGETDQRSYRIRLEEKRERAVRWVLEYSKKANGDKEAMEDFMAYEGELESVFMEIGLQVGLFIAAQMYGKMTERDSIL